MRPGTPCHHPRAPHPFGDSRTQRTGISNSNAPDLLPRAASLLSEPDWTRSADARILHGTGDTMADAGGRHDAHTGPRTTGPPPAPLPTPQPTRAGAAGRLACWAHASWGDQPTHHRAPCPGGAGAWLGNRGGCPARPRGHGATPTQASLIPSIPTALWLWRRATYALQTPPAPTVLPAQRLYLHHLWLPDHQ
jgi:hypothetical protein